ncbi:hypothetical protein EAE91_09675 [Photorhabdus noenieputensis]|uniref:hypothetical protein n=1 Tax=Photorhabdus noenieputensis TaxID=1208607 RepID=UPI001BD67500|nr:hypothetical protein [Photorhabdus noenieputensis]MBS9437431.1 hypothetical protein [Photorhabdus noenieputensis]MCK3670012.1 hypothetical protein [Photorhabdus noenieputensis]
MPFKIENLGYGEAHISDFEVSGVEYTLIIMEIISKGDSSVVLPENYSFDLNNFFEVSFDAKHNLHNNTLFERYPTNNHYQMIGIMYAVERLINEHYNAVSSSGYILLAADERLNRVYKRYINRFVTQNGFTMIDKLDPNGRGYVIHTSRTS